MIFSCPGCAAQLSVPDEMAGRAVQCPRCQSVAEAPNLAPARTEERIQSAPSLAALAPLMPAVPPRLPPEKLSHCPDCRGALAAGALECRECGWSARARDAAPRSRFDRFEENVGGGRCYIRFVRDHVDLEPEIIVVMEKLIKSERLDMRIVHEDALPTGKLGPGDLVLTGKVVHHDHGSQWMRYFLTFIALLGPGSSKLEVTAVAETAEGGEKTIEAKARQHMGLFGGTNATLMTLNVKIVASCIARQAVRHLAGYSFLNVQAHHCIYWALGLSLLGFIPLAGVVFSLIGIGCGTPGLIVVLQRKLPNGKVLGVLALVLCFLGLLANIFWIMAWIRR